MQTNFQELLDRINFYYDLYLNENYLKLKQDIKMIVLKLIADLYETEIE